MSNKYYPRYIGKSSNRRGNTIYFIKADSQTFDCLVSASYI